MSAIVEYLERLDAVDSERIVVVGICADGGYMVAAATADHRIRAAATVSTVNIGDSNCLCSDGNQTRVSKLKILDQVSERICNESQGPGPGTINYVPQVGDTSTPYDLQDAVDCSLTPRAQHPNAHNIMVDRSVPLLLNFDAYSFVDAYLPYPTSMDHWWRESGARVALGADS